MKDLWKMGGKRLPGRSRVGFKGTEFKCNKKGLIFLNLVMRSSETLEKGDSRE